MPALVLILFGAAFTLAVAYALGALLVRKLEIPAPVTLAAGAAALSLLVFLTLVAGIAGPASFGVLGAAALAAAARFGRRPDAPRIPALPLTAAVVLGAYGLLYFVHALAPEIQPDGIGYHLGLVAEYLRLGAFPHRVGFYEMVPQGMEMLFLFAFAFGRHSAAKLVHLGLLFATVPLIIHVGRRLGLKDAVSLGAAALYLCAPVVGVTGTSSYNDPALVCYTLAVFWALLVWRQEGGNVRLALAGALAGFCYAVKFPGIVVLPLAAAYVLLRAPGRARLRAAALVAVAGLLIMAPWMVRNAVAAGNPLAPLANRWFPNPYFHPLMETVLASNLSSYGGVPVWRAPWELALGGHLQGILGPFFLAVPVGLLALRRPAGRLLWLAAALVALPWFWNMGTRFLLPAVPFLALAFAMALPRPALGVAVALNAIACWPGILELYAPRHIWQLHGFPLRAALRIEPEPVYLSRTLDEYKVTRMVTGATAPVDRIFALVSPARAYLDRDTLEYWHSAEADQLLDTLKVAGLYARDPLYELRAAWPAEPLKGVRFRLAVPHPGEWCIHEVRFFLSEDRIHTSPQWAITARPNPADIAAAFDDNLATRWRTWGPMRPGMSVEAVFDRPQVLSSAVLVSHTPVYGVPVEFWGLGLDGQWRRLPAPAASLRAAGDLRRAAARAMKRAGFGYILAPAGEGGNGPLGKVMAADPDVWGMTVAGQAGPFYLFRIE